MSRQIWEQTKIFGILGLLLIPFATLIIPVSASGETLPTGPTLDRIQYFVIEDENQRFLALDNNEIDIIGEYFDPSIIDTITTEEKPWEFSNSLRNGYGYFSINCNKYPLNETSFRRAFAFALDKERICDEVWEGLAVPQDSCIPQGNPISSEGQLAFDYYENDSEMGNMILDQAGFLNIDDDSYREAPSGSDIHIYIETDVSLGVEVGEVAIDALEELGIEVTLLQPYLSYPVNPRLYYHGDYDIIFYGSSFDNFDIRWMANDFWSENSDRPFYNYPNWQNSTFDNWRDQLLHATSYAEVYEAAMAMQNIWVQDCPMVVCYENEYLSLYRVDSFTGFVNHPIQGVPGWWTNQKIRLNEGSGGPLGGTLRYSLSQDISTWNIMVAHQDYGWSLQSRTDLLVLSELYDSLFAYAPNGTILPWLVESYTIATHDDNPSIQENVTRFTLELIDGFTWSDGSALTSDDIAQSMNYYRLAVGNPFENNLEELRSAYAPTPSTLAIEFNGLSYWYLHDFAFLPILPAMITADTEPEDWAEWNILQFGDNLITSGPFNLTATEDNFIELSRNPEYYYSKNLFENTNTSTGNANPIQYILDNIVIIVFITGCSIGIITIYHLRSWED